MEMKMAFPRMIFTFTSKQFIYHYIYLIIIYLLVFSVLSLGPPKIISALKNKSKRINWLVYFLMRENTVDFAIIVDLR